MENRNMNNFIYSSGNKTVTKNCFDNKLSYTQKKKPSTSLKSDKINSNENSNSSFMCQVCHESFKSGQALGGHLSRIHPGSSSIYNAKL